MLLIGDTVEHLGDVVGTKHIMHGREVHCSFVLIEVQCKDLVAHTLAT
jgi:hypothetical protein